LREIDAAPSWETVIAAEPDLASEVTEEGLDEALEAIGGFAELKSPDRPAQLGAAPAIDEGRSRG
jgi:hypothetical protein